MENEQYQKKSDARFDRIESKLFGATFDENYGETPREQSKSISDEKTNEQHIGKKSQQVIEQELASHKQNFRENFSNDELREWDDKKASLIEELKMVIH